MEIVLLEVKGRVKPGWRDCDFQCKFLFLFQELGKKIAPFGKTPAERRHRDSALWDGGCVDALKMRAPQPLSAPSPRAGS